MTLELAANLLTIMAPVLICAALGFTWKRLGKPFHTDMVAAIVINIASPCLVFSTLTGAKVSAAAMAEVAGAFLAAFAATIVIAYLFLRAAKLPITNYLPSLIFGNSGNMGLPLCLFAFGQDGLALGIAVFTVNSLFQFTLGQVLNAGELSLKPVLRTPIIYAVTLALVFVLTATPVPQFLFNTIQVLGQIAIPLMLLALGVSLASLRVRQLGMSVLMSFVRIVMGFIVGVAVAWAFGLEGAARGVIIIQCAMPVAVFNYLFAVYYKRDAEQIAGLVVVSSLVSFATLPLLLVVALDPTILPF
ncbi:MAG: AEC family transporter [Alphaproteobacteria bacterium]